MLQLYRIVSFIPKKINLHAVSFIRNAVHFGLVSDFLFGTIVSYFYPSIVSSRFFWFLRAPVVSCHFFNVMVKGYYIICMRQKQQICHLIEKSKLAEPSQRITLKSSTERCFKALRIKNAPKSRGHNSGVKPTWPAAG